MDYTVLYMIGFVMFSIGLVFLTSYLRRNNLIKSADLIFAISVLNLTVEVISELKLEKEKEIRSIAEIVVDSLQFASMTEDLTREETINMAYDYAIDLCLAFNIDVNERRKNIIMQLLIFTFDTLDY